MLNLYINERRIEDVTVLDLKGRIRITGGTKGLHKSIRCLVEDGKTRILLNLSQVTHMDLSGLDELVDSCVTVGNQGGVIKLLHLTEQMSKVITKANLSELFDIYNNEYDAIASFKREGSRVAKPLSSHNRGRSKPATAVVHPLAVAAINRNNGQTSTAVIGK